MAERFEARVSRRFTLLLIAAILAAAAPCIWFIMDPHEIADTVPWLPNPLLVQFLGGAGVLCCVLFAAIAARQLFRTEPVIEIGPEGLRWRRWSSRTIPWAAFERTAIVQAENQRMLTLWLRDPAEYASKRFSGHTAGANKALGYGDLTLDTIGLDRSFDALVAAFEAHAGALAER
jgi:hypothetical protein